MIYLNQSDPSHAQLFHSIHWVHFAASPDEHVVVLTGVAIVDYKGRGSGWSREELNLVLVCPDFIPAGKLFQVTQWAPFVTLNAVTNNGSSAGWAVDGFGSGPEAVWPPDRLITMTAAIAAHEDNVAIRLGYMLTLRGVFVDAPKNVEIG